MSQCFLSTIPGTIITVSETPIMKVEAAIKGARIHQAASYHYPTILSHITYGIFSGSTLMQSSVIYC